MKKIFREVSFRIGAARYTYNSVGAAQTEADRLAQRQAELIRLVDELNVLERRIRAEIEIVRSAEEAA